MVDDGWGGDVQLQCVGVSGSCDDGGAVSVAYGNEVPFFHGTALIWKECQMYISVSSFMVATHPLKTLQHWAAVKYVISFDGVDIEVKYQ